MNCIVSASALQPIWIAVNTHPNRERAAEQHLRNQGYDVYGPVIRKQTRHARRVSDVLRPLFPGYIFVRLTEAQSRWRPILSTVGVRSVVCARDAPCTLPAQFITDIDAVAVTAGYRAAVAVRDCNIVANVADLDALVAARDTAAEAVFNSHIIADIPDVDAVVVSVDSAAEAIVDTNVTPGVVNIDAIVAVTDDLASEAVVNPDITSDAGDVDALVGALDYGQHGENFLNQLFLDGGILPVCLKYSLKLWSHKILLESQVLILIN